MITIVSKEKEKFEFSPKIVEFARGLELYSPEEEIVYEEIISSDFLKALKDFYEGKEYNAEKLQMKSGPIQSNQITVTLDPANVLIMDPFFKKAQKMKSLVPFTNKQVELLQGADMFRATSFRDLVSYTIATVLYCQGNQEFDVKKYRESWGITEKDTQFPSLVDKSYFYPQYIQKLEVNYRNKISKIFNPEEETEVDKAKKKEAEDQTLAQKIQEQIEMGFEFDEQ